MGKAIEADLNMESKQMSVFAKLPFIYKETCYKNDFSARSAA